MAINVFLPSPTYNHIGHRGVFKLFGGLKTVSGEAQ